MKIQPGLADRDHFRRARERGERRDARLAAIGGVMRMDSDGSENVRMAFGDLYREPISSRIVSIAPTAMIVPTAAPAARASAPSRSG